MWNMNLKRVFSLLVTLLISSQISAFAMPSNNDEYAYEHIRDYWLSRIDICKEARDYSCIVKNASNFIVNYPEDRKIEWVKEILNQYSPFEWDFQIGHYESFYDDIFTIDSDNIIVNKGRRECLTGRISSSLQVFDRSTGDSLWKREMFSWYVTENRFEENTLVVDGLEKCHWINIHTGEIDWTFEPENGYWYSGSVVSGDDVFITTESKPEQKGKLYCIDYSTHIQKWVSESNNVNEFFYILKITDDKVFVYYDVSDNGINDDELSLYPKQQIQVVSRETGKVLWKSEVIEHFDILNGLFLDDMFVITKQSDEPRIECETTNVQYENEELMDYEEPMLYDESCFYTTLLAYDTQNGKKKWTFDNEYLYNLLYNSVEDSILVSSSNEVKKLNKQTGEELWKKYYKGYLDDEYILFDKEIYFISDNTVYALNSVTGKQLWEMKTDGEYYCKNPLNISNDILYVCKENAVYAVNRISGAITWEYNKPNSSRKPILFYKSLVLITGDNNLDVIDEDSGEKKWDFRVENLYLAKALLSREKVLLALCGVNGCRMFVLDIDKGINMSKEVN